MKIGTVGFGRMGANMARRLLEAGHEVAGYDLNEENLSAAVAVGVEPASSLADLVGRLEPPRVVWSMVPAGRPTEETVDAVLGELEPGDVVVDGANSRYLDSMAVAERCRENGVRFLDVGVSGGVWGLDEGYCLMIGGPEDAYRDLEPVFRALAPEGGYARVGEHGAGHFAKMIHNAIEYAMLQSMGEGFEALHRSPFDLDLHQVARLWQNGSVVRGWLLDLLTRALEEEGSGLERIAGEVEDSGMGRWSVQYAVDHGVPMPNITQALYERFDSRIGERFSAKVIAALRNQFGGHAVVERSE